MSGNKSEGNRGYGLLQVHLTKNVLRMCRCVCVYTAISLVRVVLAVIVSITDVGRVGADARTTLKLTWSALKLSYSNKNRAHY